MIEIPQGELDGTKGVWKGGRSREARTALMSCPECGKICSLSEHEISPDGIVTPSVVCPREFCSFHDHVKLVDWSGNEKTTKQAGDSPAI